MPCLARSNAWDGLSFRLFAEPGCEARELFAFVGAWAPAAADIALGWGAWVGETLVGAALLERAGSSAMLHGPAITPPAGADPESTLDATAGLVAMALAATEAAKIETLFARPQGLDRVWVRLGFIPVPEAELPEALRGRPGIGLFGWRGGSALWSAAGRDRRAVPAFR
jgi:hypothetical protein